MTKLSELSNLLSETFEKDHFPPCHYFGMENVIGCHGCPAFGSDCQCSESMLRDIAAKLREIASEMEPIAEGDIVRHPDAACDLKVANVFDIDGKPMLTASHMPDCGYAPIVTVSDFAENFARA